MGVVYHARHLALNRIVALKMIRAGDEADDEELIRFRAEAEAVARLHHANIVQIYEVGDHAGRPFCALEYVDGGNLAHQLAQTPQPARYAAAVVQALARAIHHAHAQGIVHRDLKPSNVLLTTEGTPKITDFGLAKKLDDDNGRTRTGAVMGTPSYMAPEQAAGRTKDVGPLVDVYALGAILYEMQTGRPPFRGVSMFDTLEPGTRHRRPVPRAANSMTRPHRGDSGNHLLEVPARRNRASRWRGSARRGETGRRPAPLPRRQADPGTACRYAGAGLALVPTLSAGRDAPGRLWC